MIIISKDDQALRVVGHAVTGAPPGQNIVCAAVSAITLTLIEGLEHVAGVEITELIVEPGCVLVHWYDLNEIGKALIDTWFLGIEQIREDYGHIEIR